MDQSEVNENDVGSGSNVWINLMFLVSIAIVCAGAGRLTSFVVAPSVDFGSPSFLRDLLLSIVFVIGGISLIIGMMRQRRWVLNLAVLLIVFMAILQVATILFIPFENWMTWMAVGTILLLTVGVSGLVISFLRSSSMKGFFSK